VLKKAIDWVHANDGRFFTAVLALVVFLTILGM
jgi:hypothetical protein